MAYLPAAERTLDLVPDPTIIVDLGGTILWGNAAAWRFTGHGRDEWMGRSMFELLHPDDHATAIAGFAFIGDDEDNDGVGGLIDVRIRDAIGAWRPCEARGRFVPADPDEGTDEHAVIVFRDVTDRHDIELGGGDHARLRALVHHAHSILMALDADGQVRSSNAELTRMLGHDPALVRGKPFVDLLHEDDRIAFARAMMTVDGGVHLDTRALDTAGQVVHLDIWLTDLRADNLQQGFVVSATDITDLKQTQQVLRHMADHDALTGLLSRGAMLRQLDELAQQGLQHEIVMLFCDLDGFKDINDRIGHAAGDQVLVEVARRLERSTRPHDLVGRLGGDEFVLVMPRSTVAEAELAALAIRALMIEPILVADQVVEIDVSIGIASSGGSPDVARLLATADDAMYAVKKTRKPV